MADRMYQITVMGVLDHALVAIKVYSSEAGHWVSMMQTEVLVRHEMEDSTDDDLLAIGNAICRFARGERRV